MIPELEISVALTMLKPAEEVFEAIVDPAKMSGYFISQGSGRMESGTTVEWTFPEMYMSFPVTVLTAEANTFISFRWGSMDGSETQVDMTIKPLQENATQVRIVEGKKQNNEAGIKWFKENTEGWANFLCCLKAYLEYGINLRKGAFEREQMPKEMSDV